MRKKFIELCKKELDSNKNSFVLLGDIGVGGFLKEGDQLIDRVLNMGIAEQAMVGFGAGLSANKGNIILHTITPFLVERALEQIKLCAGYNELKIILVGANGPYDYDKLGPTHFCPADVSILSTIPNLDIRLPSTLSDFESSFEEALNSNRSLYLRLTSRFSDIQKSLDEERGYKKIFVKNGSLTLLDSGYRDKAFVCVGESLSYVIKNKLTNGDITIFWTSNPNSFIPTSVYDYRQIEILEPYYGEHIKALGCQKDQLIRKTFNVENKKKIVRDLGWENFD